LWRILVHGPHQMLRILPLVVLQPLLDVRASLGRMPYRLQHRVGRSAGRGLQQGDELPLAHLSGTYGLGIVFEDQRARMFSRMRRLVLGGAVGFLLVGIAGLACTQLGLQPARFKQLLHPLVSHRTLQSEGIVGGTGDRTCALLRLDGSPPTLYFFVCFFFHWEASCMRGLVSSRETRISRQSTVSLFGAIRGVECQYGPVRRQQGKRTLDV